MLKGSSNILDVYRHFVELASQVLFIFSLCSLMMLLSIAFAVMHELRLIHTDLKPENILLVSSDYVKVPDYKDYKVLSALILVSFKDFCTRCRIRHMLLCQNMPFSICCMHCAMHFSDTVLYCLLRIDMLLG